MASVATGMTGFSSRQPPGEETQRKLNALSSQFNAFFPDLKEETAVRKKAEDVRIARIERELGRLEKAISVEARRRIEATKAVQLKFEEKLDAIQVDFRAQIKTNTEGLQAEIAALHEKIAALEVRMDEERDNREREVQRHNKEVLEKFDAHTKEFEVEKASRGRKRARAAPERGRAHASHPRLPARRSPAWSARRSCSSASATRPSASSRRWRRSASSATARWCR